MHTIHNAPSMFEVAELVGDALREVRRRDGPTCSRTTSTRVPSFIIGGQIRGEPQRLFHVYSEGNFIEATAETPYFQIGESKYGKPMIDRVVKRGTSLGKPPSACWCRSTRPCAATSRSACRSICSSTTRQPAVGHAAAHRGGRSLLQMIRSRWGDGLRNAVRAAAQPRGSRRRVPDRRIKERLS